MARRIRRQTLGKNSVKHSQTILANVGSASVPTRLIVIQTDVGDRLVSGAAQIVKDQATTGNTCNVGDIVKYVNICIQCSPRTTIDPNDDSTGWLEYACVFQEEQAELMTTGSLGTQTLMDTANKQYREMCFFTGCMPIGDAQSNSVDLKLKIPRKFTKITVGNNLSIFAFFRSNNSAAVGTSTNRLIMSAIYKAYS